MKKVLLTIIGIYRKWISPALPGRCRFAPTCSAYAHEALEKHGPLKGSVLTASRLARCHPFNPGGWDPVPPVSDYRSNGVTVSKLSGRANNQLTTSAREKDLGGQEGSGSVLHPDTSTPRYPDTQRG